MRSRAGLWPAAVDVEALWRAWAEAARGKRRRPDVMSFERRLFERLGGLHAALVGESWRPGSYRVFDVVERGKRRRVAAAPFADRVVHHALVAALAPPWEARFMGWSCANRVGRGTHRALALAARGTRRCRFGLFVDVARYFPSVDHGVLLGQLARHLVDAPLLHLLARVIDSGRDVFGPHEAWPALVPGDDLLTLARPRGLPIGNQTSQFFANVVLHDVDRVVAHEIKPLAAVRYVDDLVLFDDDAGKLRAARERIVAALTALRLRAHPRKTRLFESRHGVTFVGYRLTPQGIRLPRATVSRFHRHLHRLQRAVANGDAGGDEVRQVLSGLRGHVAPLGATSVLERLLIAHGLAPDDGPGNAEPEEDA
jgi:hypothetical protein